jgi:hypothetical protein
VLGVLLKPIVFFRTLVQRRTSTEARRHACAFERFLSEMKAQNERLRSEELQAVPARSRSLESS